MKKILFLFLVTISTAIAVSPLPIINGRLQNNLNGASNSITNIFIITGAGNTNGIAPLVIKAGKLTTTPVPNAVENDGTNLSYTTAAGVRSAVGSGGSVTSVALTPPGNMTVIGSPITTSGTFVITNNIASSNTFWCGPSSGTPGQPSFRAIVAADLPAISATAIDFAGGRLTLASLNPVTSTNITSATTIYYTPYKNDYITLYDGSSTWTTLQFAELSLAVPATTSTMYDMFIYNNSGTATLEALAWTSDTVRATGLTRVNGRLTKASDSTRRFIGCFRTTTVSGKCETSFGGTSGGGTPALWYVWNKDNQVDITFQVSDNTDTWTYTSATERPINNSVGNRVSYISGLNEDPIASLCAYSFYNTAIERTFVGVGIDSTNSMSGVITPVQAANSSAIIGGANGYWGRPGIGFHFIQGLERGGTSGTTTFEGDAGSATQQGGLQVRIKG